MDFYRCFICEVTLKDEKDFENHLQQLSHLRSLEDRKLLSSEHLDMLILVDQFKLGKNFTPKEANHEIVGEKEDFHSCSSADQEFRENTDCEPESSETRSDEKPSSSKSAGSATNNQNDKLGVLSLDCLICVKRMVNLDEVKKHMNQEAHLKLQNFKMKTSSLLKPFRCLICKLDLDPKEIRWHLLIVHLKVQPDFLQSRSRNDLMHFECIPCNKKIDLEQYTPHLQSIGHVQKLKTSPMEYFLRCKLCNMLFNSILQLQKHSKVKIHETRSEVLNFFP